MWFSFPSFSFSFSFSTPFPFSTSLLFCFVNWIIGVAVIQGGVCGSRVVFNAKPALLLTLLFIFTVHTQLIYLTRNLSFPPPPTTLSLVSSTSFIGISTLFTFFYFLFLSVLFFFFFVFHLPDREEGASWGLNLFRNGLIWTDPWCDFFVFRGNWIGLWVLDRIWRRLRSILPFVIVCLRSTRISRIGVLIWGYGLFSLFRFERGGEAKSWKGKRWWSARASNGSTEHCEITFWLVFLFSLVLDLCRLSGK